MIVAMMMVMIVMMMMITMIITSKGCDRGMGWSSNKPDKSWVLGLERFGEGGCLGSLPPAWRAREGSASG